MKIELDGITLTSSLSDHSNQPNHAGEVIISLAYGRQAITLNYFQFFELFKLFEIIKTTAENTKIHI